MMDFESWFIYVLKENHDNLLRYKSLYNLLEMAFDAGISYQHDYSLEDELVSLKYNDEKILESIKETDDWFKSLPSLEADITEERIENKLNFSDWFDVVISDFSIIDLCGNSTHYLLELSFDAGGDYQKQFPLGEEVKKYLDSAFIKSLPEEMKSPVNKRELSREEKLKLWQDAKKEKNKNV